MAFQLSTKVALKLDLPAQKLRQGDVATIVDAQAGRRLSQETAFTQCLHKLRKIGR